MEAATGIASGQVQVRVWHKQLSQSIQAVIDHQQATDQSNQDDLMNPFIGIIQFLICSY